eukprot:5174059-Prymnesium_polylepis.1
MLGNDEHEALAALFTLGSGEGMARSSGRGRASDGLQAEVAEALGQPRQTVYNWFKRGAKQRAAAAAGEG